jgi:hypothetical protein
LEEAIASVSELVQPSAPQRRHRRRNGRRTKRVAIARRDSGNSAASGAMHGRVRFRIGARLTTLSRMSHADGHPPEPGDAVPVQSVRRIEIVSPIADAMGVLAELIQRTRGSLAGASIAKSDRGTLLLNSHAWSLFGEALRREIVDLVVLQPARDSSTPIRFVLVTSEMPAID